MTDLSLSPSSNATNIVLIPKYKQHSLIKDLRPIYLCNILYKLVAKVLANRLKILLPGIISIFRSAFIKDSAITDNVISAFEIIHSMNHKTRGKIGDIALKIDYSKAYLKLIMLEMGLSKRWVDLILMCVSMVSYSVRVSNISQFWPKH